MTKGESSREKTKWEIESYLCTNGPSTSRELFEKCTCAKATFYKYLDELIESGDIICKLQRGRGEHLYEPSEKARNLIEEKAMKQKLKDEIDKLPMKQIRTLYEFVDKTIMKSVSLILDTVELEKLLEGLQKGKILKEQIGELREKYAQQKKALFAERPYFFTNEDIDKMTLASLLEKGDAFSQERIKWFEKWFGTLV
jgi:predicted transcriptional regulator